MITVTKFKTRFFCPNPRKGVRMASEKNNSTRSFEREDAAFPFTMNTMNNLARVFRLILTLKKNPVYTDDGRPFVTAEQESCVHGKPKEKGKGPPVDCGSCGWLHREQTAYDLIGVCMCDARRCKNE